MMVEHGKRRKVMIFMAFLSFLIIPISFQTTKAQDLDKFEKHLTEFTLKNGLKFLIYERHEAPVVSFHTYANVGGVDEVTGITGLAHLFEHLAFKGTKTIGTKNYKAEEKAMEKADEIFQQIKIEKRKGNKADPNVLAELQNQFDDAQAEAQKYIVHDEYDETFTRAGAVGFNAHTGRDATQFTVSLPSNKVELWMSLESDRFANPVLREFYKERDVVIEELRMRENDPEIVLYEELCAAAFKAHPYGEPVIGQISDLQTITRAEAKAFFKKYYCPNNLTIVIVGDAYPDQIKKLAEKYFSRIPAGPEPEPVETIEPPQRGERRVTVEYPSQPEIMIGYHQPSVNDPNNAVFQAITEILANGRTSRLYTSLVKEKKIAISADAGQSWSKYPSLFYFMAIPAKGHTNKECEDAIYAEIEKLKNEPVSQSELDKAKNNVRATLIRQLDSNAGLAEQLAFYEVVEGDWRNLFKEPEDIRKVTPEDIEQVVKQYFTKTNRTVAEIETSQIDQ